MEPNMAVLGTVISILFAGNIFFIKKLVEKIEMSSISAGELKQGMASIKTDVNAIGAQLRDVKSEIKDLRRVEIEVAVVKAQMGLKNLSKDSDG